MGKKNGKTNTFGEKYVSWGVGIPLSERTMGALKVMSKNSSFVIGGIDTWTASVRTHSCVMRG
jgi:anti-sigma regulatory factor (Ser/Thr protein kinase)